MTDIIDAVRVLIEDSRLSGYFHLGKLDRTGVQVIDAASATGIASEQVLSGQAIITPANSVVEAGRVALFIDSAKCDGRAASMKWRLPDEGISGTATLQQSSGQNWTVEKFRLVER